MKRSIWIGILGICVFARADFYTELVKTFSGTSLIVQTQSDPSEPARGWILTEEQLYFHGPAKNGGAWELQFDRRLFREISGDEAGDGYRHRKLQVSRAKKGSVYLLLENSRRKEEKRSRYIFGSQDGGDTWKVVRVVGPAADGKIPQRFGRISASRKKASRVKTRRVTAAEESVAVAPSIASGGEESVDLAALDVDAPSAGPSRGGSHGGGGGSPSAPNFKVMFDLWLTLREGIAPLTFDNFHSLLFFEYAPFPDIQFGFEVAPSPRFYELTYRINPHLEFRAGKIWIPFDQLSFFNPHNLFGGLINVSRFRQQGGSAFLPDIWTDLGVAFKYTMVDKKNLSVDLQGYVTNGFQNGGTDPAGEVANDYPSFDMPPLQDNNTDKAIGGRLNVLISNQIGLGVSGYTARYSPDGAESARIMMFGGDGQLRLPFGVDLRGGYIFMNTDLPAAATEDSFRRGGYYVEASKRLMDKWKLSFRMGSAQTDDRVVSVNDVTFMGGSLVYNIGYMQLNFMHFRDLQTIPGKTGYSFSAVRASVML